MSQEAVERVLGRLITDERFRSRVLISLEEASMQEGYPLSTSEVKLLSGLKLQGLSEIAGRLHPGLCRAGPTAEVKFK